MRRRRGIRRVSRGSLISYLVLVALFFIVVQGFMIIERNFRPAILAAAKMRADGLATDAISYAILEKVAGKIAYQDLIMIEKDEQGRIVMAQINPVEVNRVMAETTLATRDALQQLESEPFEIPLGEATDSYILAAYGPKIPVKMIPVSRVKTSVVDSFDQAGINQTRHKIYLEVYVEVQIVIPFVKDSVEVTATVPVADAVYIGEVPDAVFNLQFPPGGFID